jgi:hypothetical protein
MAGKTLCRPQIEGMLRDWSLFKEQLATSPYGRSFFFPAMNSPMTCRAGGFARESPSRTDAGCTAPLNSTLFELPQCHPPIGRLSHAGIISAQGYLDLRRNTRFWQVAMQSPSWGCYGSTPMMDTAMMTRVVMVRIVQSRPSMPAASPSSREGLSVYP